MSPTISIGTSSVVIAGVTENPIRAYADTLDGGGARRRYPDRTSGLRFWLAQGAFADQHFVGRAEGVEPSRDPAIGCRVQ